MYTGIIKQIGKILSIENQEDGKRIFVQWNPSGALAVDDSIAVDGCCLTVTSIDGGRWSADVTPETLSRTTLGSLLVGDPVNLELPMKLGDSFGGHWVQGHIDGVGQILSKQELSDQSWVVTFEAPASVMRYVIEKGSIAIDGVSLTVAELHSTSFSVAMIPHTAQKTTLGSKQPGDTVNLEADMMAKYVERYLKPMKEQKEQIG